MHGMMTLRTRLPGSIRKTSPLALIQFSLLRANPSKILARNQEASLKEFSLRIEPSLKQPKVAVVVV